MMRRIALVAVAATMPMAAATAVAVAGSGLAGAAKPPPGPITCSQTGSVTFAKPGLSDGGALTTKSSVTTKSAVTPTGTGCSGSPSKLNIVTSTTPCPQTNGVPNSGDPQSCLQSKTNGKGVTTYEIAKKPNYYDTVGDFASSGGSDLEAALAASGGLSTKDNGNKVLLAYNGSGSVSEVLGGACGSQTDGNPIVGFDITGPVTENGASTGLNYDDLVCITSDTGTGTTGDFYGDLTTAAGGGSDVISSGVLGGNSTLTITSNVEA